MSIPTARCMSPVPSTSWAASSPQGRLRPGPPGIGRCWTGPGVWARWRPGVEGTGCSGAALARFLDGQGQLGWEVNRPDRSARRQRGKSDPVDAEAAARAVLAGQVTAVPKAGGHLVEMVRCLRVARASAVKARIQAANALRALVVTAPAELREQLRDLPSVGWPARRRGCAQGRS